MAEDEFDPEAELKANDDEETRKDKKDNEGSTIDAEVEEEATDSE